MAKTGRISPPCSSSCARSSRASPGKTASSKDRKSTRLNSSHGYISYAVFCLKKKKNDLPRKREPDVTTDDTRAALPTPNLVIALVSRARSGNQADFRHTHPLTPNMAHVLRSP